jgi:Ni2+-binding GTPase involved in maturation of urease and hydrogenase
MTRVANINTCCSKKVELMVVDSAGNMGVYLGSVKDSVGVVVSSTAQGQVSILKTKSIIITIPSYCSKINLAIICFWETGPRSPSPTLQLYL